MIYHCIQYNNGHCDIASRIAGVPAPIQGEACSICQKSSRPMTLNVVTCQLAYAVSKDPRIKEAFNQLNHEPHNRPGTCLRTLLQELGITEGKACQCDEYASIMNMWGTQGCVERMDDIVDHLNSQSVSWFDIAKVILGGYLTTRSLVEEAIKCSKERS